jgi:hypothetical protein
MISYYSTYAVPHADFNKAVAEGYSIFDTIVQENAGEVKFKVFAFAGAAATAFLGAGCKLVLDLKFTPEEFEKSKSNLLANSIETNVEGEPI